MATKPIFSKQARSYTNSADYVRQLEELSKRNKGGFSAFAEDTRSSVPFKLPGKKVASAIQAKPSARPSLQLPEAQDYQVEIPPVQEIPPQPQQQGLSLNDFISQFSQSVGFTGPTQEQQEAIFQQKGIPYVVSETEAGKVLNTGETLDNQTGNITLFDGTVANPVASMADGSIMYSDGKTRKFDPSGIGPTGFMKAIFGGIFPVSQVYGNENDAYASGYHSGTDIAIGPTPFISPVEGKVVSIARASDGGPYGNSIVVQYATGESIRYSHLSHLGNFNEGDTILPGEYVGTTGNTGNVYSETGGEGYHLDYEVYGADGKLKPPTEFTAFSTPEAFNTQSSQEPTQPEQSPTNPNASYEVPQGQIDPQAAMDVSPMDTLNQLASQAGMNIAEGINTLNPTGEQIDFGVTENLQGNPELAAQKQAETIANVGTSVSAPELYTNELQAAQGTNPLEQFAGNIIDYGATKIGEFADKLVPDTYAADVLNKDYGLSESVAGGKTTNTAPEVDPNSVLRTALKSGMKVAANTSPIVSGLRTGKEALSLGMDAAKGIGSLFSKGVNNLFSKPTPNEMAPQSAVGNIAGGQSSQSSTPVNASMETYNPGDPFQKFTQGGGAAQFANYLTPTDTSGALSTDMFTPEFFQNKGNIQSVFGDAPHLMQQAMGKYQAFEDKKAADEAARMQDMQQKPGELWAEYMKRTGGQSTLDEIRSNPRLSLNEGSGDVAEVGSGYHPSDAGSMSPRQMADYGSRTGQGVTSYKKPSGGVVKAGPNQVFRADSEGQVQSVRPYESPVKDTSATLTYASQNKPSLFQQAGNYVSNIFRKVFN